MDNHYHLVLETPDGHLAKGMRQLNGIYTHQFNQAHQRGGPVFQGRYKAIFVEPDRYLLTLCRYVVLNPVRASRVENVEAYRWSSYRAMAGLNSCPPWLATDGVLGQFRTDRIEAQKHYRQLVQEGMEAPSPWRDLKGQVFLGQATYMSEMEERLSAARQVREVPRVQRYADRPILSEFLEPSTPRSRVERDNLIYIAYRDYGYAMISIANELGLHNSTISRISSVKKEPMMQDSRSGPTIPAPVQRWRIALSAATSCYVALSPPPISMSKCKTSSRVPSFVYNAIAGSSSTPVSA